MLLIILIGGLTQLFLPWWSIAIIAAIVGFLFKFDNSGWSFLAGFLAVLLLWSGYILSERMGNLFGNISSGSVILLTGLIGGLVGGFFAMTGTLGQKMISHSN